MEFVIEVVGPSSHNVAFVTVTKIGNRAALDICYLTPPSPGEIDAVNLGVKKALEVAYGCEPVVLANERMDDPEARQLATRRFFGGGQG